MNIIELIGFIIIIFSMAILYIKNKMEQDKAAYTDVDDERQLNEREKAERALIQALGLNPPPPPPPKLVEETEELFEDEEIEEVVVEKPMLDHFNKPLKSKKKLLAKSILHHVSLKDAMVIKEILDKPRSLKSYDDTF